MLIFFLQLILYITHLKKFFTIFYSDAYSEIVITIMLHTANREIL